MRTPGKLRPVEPEKVSDFFGSMHTEPTRFQRCVERGISIKILAVAVKALTLAGFPFGRGNWHPRRGELFLHHPEDSGRFYDEKGPRQYPAIRQQTVAP